MPKGVFFEVFLSSRSWPNCSLETALSRGVNNAKLPRCKTNLQKKGVSTPRCVGHLVLKCILLWPSRSKCNTKRTTTVSQWKQLSPHKKSMQKIGGLSVKKGQLGIGFTTLSGCFRGNLIADEPPNLEGLSISSLPENFHENRVPCDP